MLGIKSGGEISYHSVQDTGFGPLIHPATLRLAKLAQGYSPLVNKEVEVGAKSNPRGKDISLLTLSFGREFFLKDGKKR